MTTITYRRARPDERICRLICPIASGRYAVSA
jgi:hypothetical protein